MVRKTVTVLFADVTGSTALGESLDPEALRRVMTQYYELARATLERHGGTVEKFIGDAVMAVFGIPQAHEDDALRALRAAVELRDADLGVTLRIGVNTGEVVTGDADTLVTGDAVNVAARLEQAAAAGEVLVGDATYRLARNALRVEEAAPIDAKGKSKPVPAWRLVEVLDDVPAFTRRLDAPFVGRGDELAQLLAAFDRAATGTAQRVTVIGAGGIGKSRLARELIQQVGDRARVVVGRCLPYGEGITYWPIAEIVRQTAGDRDAIRALVDGESADLVADRIAAVTGLGGLEGAKEETQWAVRRLLEALASELPLIAVFDDLHWAEPTFLDLVEYVSDFASAPLFVFCSARPDLLDARPGWTMPRPNTLTLVLERLGDAESGELIDKLLADADISDDERRHVAEAAEGNPLFVEQLLAMRAEADGADWTIPPTIQALLAARIDGLASPERAVVERASVEGRLFHRGAVVELAPEDVRPDVGAHLGALVRKEFVRPDRSQLPGDDGYRFAHILVRDAAYDAMAKELRADLHERFVAWLERVAPDRAQEWEEIVGYHLEQAALYRREVGLPDGRDVASRAAELLGRSGERAHDRGDLPAARNLLGRATSLLPANDALRVRLLPLLGFTIYTLGEFETAQGLLEGAQAEAEAAGDHASAANAWAVLSLVRFSSSVDLDLEEMERRVQTLIPDVERSGDLRALVSLRLAELNGWLMRAQFAKVVEVAELLLPAARAVGDRNSASQAVFWLASGPQLGPTPLSELVPLCERVKALAEGPLEAASVMYAEAWMRAMQGRFDEARELGRQSRATHLEFGMPLVAAGTCLIRGTIELVAGDNAAAEREFREGCDELRALGESGYLSTDVGYLAEALYRLGRLDEAEEATRESEAASHPRDASSQGIWRSVRARILARRGRFDEAERMTREAIAWLESTDGLDQIGSAYASLAEVLDLAGRRDEAIAALEHALELYEQKEHGPLIEQAEVKLAALRS